MYTTSSTCGALNHLSGGNGRSPFYLAWSIACLMLTAHAHGAPGKTDATPPKPPRIDRFHTSMTVSANEAARWIDSFFEDERYITEEASSRIRLRPSLLLEEGEGANLKFSVDAKLNVPRFNRKLKLIVSDEDNDIQNMPDSQRFTTSGDSLADEANIGLQYTLRDKDSLNTHIATGIKVGGNHGVDLFIGPRLRKTWQPKPWQLRFTERIRWYTDIGWESRTRLDIERVIHTAWFFRGTFDVRLREDDYSDSGMRYSINQTLVQKLRHRAAIEYQWNTGFVTRPNHRVDETGLRLRFRQQIWRDWLFYEINPQLVFRNNDNFRVTPGIEFRLEASFGGLDQKLQKTAGTAR